MTESMADMQKSTENKGKFVAYSRVSTEQQGRSGPGLEAQKKAQAYFAQERCPIRVGAFSWRVPEKTKGTRRHQERPRTLGAIRRELTLAKWRDADGSK